MSLTFFDPEPCYRYVKEDPKVVNVYVLAPR